MYEKPLPVNSVKIKNVIALSAFLKKPNSVAFYEKFKVAEADNNIDLDEDNNSDGCD